ncbi:lectin [Aquirhabdus parva]|uniref:Lectin n=1 Tax=Aquirhabdus parva TaxID=2283318 RepID=A0A345P7P1_9GAMM|nr:lectin [Aquirhabdus parva]AXI03300.1 lectin [Aquirhabdus parva]
MVAKRSKLDIGQVLYMGDFLTSPQDLYRLIMHPTGNLVIYNQSNGNVKWNSNTSGDRNWAVLQSDGNFVVYNSKGDHALWHSKSGRTNAAPLMQIVLQDDGNLVIYSEDATPVWSSSGGLVRTKKTGA